MLDDSVAPPAGDDSQVLSAAQRATLILRRVARVVAVPALLLMLGGLLAYGIGSRQFLAFGWDGLPGPTAEAWRN